MSDKMDKGGVLEEILREYFLSLNYFAVRGVPVTYGGEDITDIDMWLYLRPSVLTRERVNVDAKNRAKPHSLERVLWAKGLQHVLGFDSCIVATTDSRPLTKEYGHKHGVLVLDGAFVGWLKRNGPNTGRISDEEFDALLGPTKDDKLIGDWRRRLKAAKARLAMLLGFDACNLWLPDIQYFVEQSASTRHDAAIRIVYLLVSYFLIGIDFALRTLAFEEGELRRKTLNEGFVYGAQGPKQIKLTLDIAVDLMQAVDPSLSSRVRAQALEGLEKIGESSEPLAEFFAKSETGGALFGWARAFEAKAYARISSSPGSLDTALQAVLGVLLDYFKMERRAFLK